jgi:hypothetical protein
MAALSEGIWAVNMRARVGCGCSALLCTLWLLAADEVQQGELSSSFRCLRAAHGCCGCSCGLFESCACSPELNMTASSNSRVSQVVSVHLVQVLL